MVDRMAAGYRIKELAERSGFTSTALRYYEEIGLLPKAERTPAGYRVYDDRALERLAFISRAKQLGCTLEEITDLTTAWEGGRCGPIQDRLRQVVADKIAESQAQIAELIALSADLQRAAVALERHRPDGPCDEGCGCVTDPAADGSPTAAPVSLIADRLAATDETVACTLRPGELGRRAEEWQAVLEHVVTRQPIPRKQPSRW